MRFESIKLYGFKDKKRFVNLKFSNEPVSIIYGENGCGKTSLLKVLNAILIKDENTLINENINKAEIIISQDEILSEIIIKRKEIVDNSEHFNDSEEEILQGKYEWINYDESEIEEASSILFGVNRGITNTVNITPEQIEKYFMTKGRIYARAIDIRRINILSEDLSNYLNRYKLFNKRVFSPYTNWKKVSKLSNKNSVLDKLDMETIEELIFNRYTLANHKKIERVQNALFETLSYAIYSGETENNIIHDIPENFDELLIHNRDKLLEALRDTNENKLQKNIINIMEQNDIQKIISECKNNNLLLNLLVKMIEELKEEEAILESINTLEMIFNNQISDKKRLVVNKDGVIIKFDDEENSHGLNGLSSGERHLLSFLTIFLIEGKHRDILMIDEPELSLNIKWQREILNILKTVAPRSQIIVASHSSIIGRKNTNYLVKLD